MKNLVSSFEHGYKIPWHAEPSKCQVEIYSDQTKLVVVLTELHDNRGMSVTNAAEFIATSLLEKLGGKENLSNITWVEHYTERPGITAVDPETFDLVTFTWEGNKAEHVRWKPLEIEDFKRLINE